MGTVCSDFYVAIWKSKTAVMQLRWGSGVECLPNLRDIIHLQLQRHFLWGSASVPQHSRGRIRMARMQYTYIQETIYRVNELYLGIYLYTHIHVHM